MLSRSGMFPTSREDSQSSLSETKDLNASSFVRSCDAFRFFFSQINELLSFEVIPSIGFLRDGHEQQYGRFIGKANIACRIKEDYIWLLKQTKY